MPHYEYKCGHETNWDTADMVTDYLNRMASEGWRVLHVDAAHLWLDYKFIFERAVEVEDEPKKKGKGK